MKTSELIEQVEAMGLGAVDTGFNIGIDNDIGDAVAIVSKNEMFTLSTRYWGIGKLTDEAKESLFRLLTEYAGTPIEEREPENKYKLKFPGVIESCAYLNYIIDNERFYTGTEIDNSIFKTAFTQSEIDNFPEDIKRLITVAERIEVEE